MYGVGRVLSRIGEIKSMFNTMGPVLPPTGQIAGAQAGNGQAVGGTANTDFDKALLAAQIKNGMSLSGSSGLSEDGGLEGLAQFGLQTAGQAGSLSGNSPGRFDSIIESTAAKYGIDPALVKAVMTAESGGNPSARSSAGATGLMQLMPATARGLGVSNPLDPAQNIEGGTKYLKGQLDRFKDINLALAAYNAGPGAVRKYGGVPPYRETQNYVTKVNELYRKFKNG